MNLFTKHPSSVGENYLQHMKTSFSFGFQLLTAGAGCLAHGLFPFVFVRTGSNTIASLHDKMMLHRDKRAMPQQSAQVDHG